MKRLSSIFFLTLVVNGLPAVDAQNPEDAPTIPSRIVDVTGYADRAQITRTANVNLAAESSRIAITKLPGWIDEVRIEYALEYPTDLLARKAPADAAPELPHEQIKSLERRF